MSVVSSTTGSSEQGVPTPPEKMDPVPPEQLLKDVLPPENLKTDESTTDDVSKTDGIKTNGSTTDVPQTEGVKTEGSTTDTQKTDGVKTESSTTDTEKTEGGMTGGSTTDTQKTDGGNPQGTTTPVVKTEDSQKTEEKPEDKIFNKAQQDWLADALSLEEKLDGIENDMANQEKFLTDIDGYFEEHLLELQVGDVFSAEVIEPGAFGAIRNALGLNATMWTVSKDGKPQNEIDLDNEVIKRLDKDPAKAEAKAKKLFAAQNMIMAQVQKMRSQKKADGTPLFTDREIADEVFAPLMRQKVIPESFIPDKYSEVSRVFQGASDEYQQRLTAYSESLNDNDGVLRKLGIGQDFVNTAGTLASSAITMAGLLGGGSVANTLSVDQVSNIVKMSTAVLTGGMDMAQQILKTGGINKDNFIAIAKDLVGIASSTILVAFTGQWGTSDKAHQGLAKAIGSGLQIGLASASFGIDLYNKQYDKAIADLGDIAASSAMVYYNNTAIQGTTTTNSWNESNTGQAVSAGIKTAASVVGLAVIIENQRKKVEEGGEWDP
ncbi:MAG TPA: hypothetical protein VKS60_25050, partial [Stellaceae bacterium]|nr:hypothetical protein [Stellaceae bacterium]